MSMATSAPIAGSFCSKAFRSTPTQQHNSAGTRGSRLAAVCAQGVHKGTEAQVASRRDALLSAALAASTALFRAGASQAASLPDEQEAVICDGDCVAALDTAEMVTTPSGLKYKDIKVGSGVSPKVGYQVVANYIAMTDKGRIFDSSLARGFPYDFRVGTGQVIPGLDEGLLTMRTGGIRRLYIPGNLSFPKTLAAAPGRPSVPANSPVMFDVQLLYIPGVSDPDEE